MSDDLISRKMLVGNLKLFLDRSFLGETTAHDCISVGEIAGLIKDEPTAYDVDKVIEQITELQLKIKNKLLEVEDEEYAAMLRGQLRGISDCLEIIKQGGISNGK